MFLKTRSINQGCPYSPSIFLLIGEILANHLQGDSRIRGLRIGETELLLSQFADDTDLYLPFEKCVLDAVFEILDQMECNLGLKVSYKKTTLYRIGSIAFSNAKIYTRQGIK